MLNGGAPVSAATDRPPVNQAQRTFDFGKLGRIKEGSPVERAKLGIEYIREEVDHPTPPYQGLGGIIHHDYILSQLAHALSAGEPDQDVLWAEIQNNRQEVREVLTITLGLTGNRRVLGPVSHYLRDVTKPIVLREYAARALGEIDDLDSISVLVDVMLHDRLCYVRPVEPGSPPLERYYQIRDAARLALRTLKEAKQDLGETVERALSSAVVRVPLDQRDEKVAR